MKASDMNLAAGNTDEQRDGELACLPGEKGIADIAAPAKVSVSKKGLFAVALFVLSLGAASAISIQHALAGKKPEDAASRRAGDRPAAASVEPRKLDLSVRAIGGPASTANSSTRIPALVPTAEEEAEPIGVHRTGQDAHAAAGATTRKSIPPEDAPVLVVSSRPAGAASSQRPSAQPAGTEPSANASFDALEQTRHNLENYERQLQGMLDSNTRPASGGVALASASPVGVLPAGVPSARAPSLLMGSPPSGALFGGQLQSSVTPRVVARMLGDRSLILPKGTAFTCALTTKVVSAASGLVGCEVQRNVYSDDGRVLLIERGSHMDGEYRIAAVKPGTTRIPVLWTRIRTSNGVTVDIDSPGTGPLGESGIDGYVDNRWGERIGAALLLSLIDDSVQLALQHESGSGQGNAIVLPATTGNTSKLADKVLDSTINIPPLIYQNQGGIVGIYVARDVDFSSVYELRPSER
ncbi:MAG: type IV secretion system protein VirB10 [Pseudomonadota bacterium]|nr:type IV secretion system protein VirB10 [Pseudomonadota bacterium]MDQ2801887.1 type IV secretion system protein VirB10 [Pseudomonadota bacterium]